MKSIISSLALLVLCSATAKLRGGTVNEAELHEAIFASLQASAGAQISFSSVGNGGISSGPGWTAVTDHSSPAGVWVIADTDGNELASGTPWSRTGGLASLVEALEDNKVMFAAIRVVGVDEQENVTSERPKIIRINWVGSKVPAMKKMSALRGKSKIADMWNGVAAEIDANSTEDINTRSVCLELLRTGGAHKPTAYDFGPGEKIPLSDCKA